MEAETAIWPHDVLNELVSPERDDPHHLRVFLICPFTPKDLFDDLYSLVEGICKKIGHSIIGKVECLRADKITSPGVIHSEIWREIQTADAVIADVSRLNGNVMVELGVASACRKKHHVIILKEENPNERFLFDIGPARHIVYKRTSMGFRKLEDDLFRALLMSLTPAPLEFEPKTRPELPLKADFTSGKDVNWLVGPSITHRSITPDYLEFGSLFVFKNSWLSVANLELSDFEITAEMKFSKLRNEKAWIGISVRNQHFFANFGHLLYLGSNGKVERTVPEDDLGRYHGDKLGSFSGFDPTGSKFYEFRIKADGQAISMYVDDEGDDFKVTEMPHVYPVGKILFQTANARAAIKSSEINPR